MGKDQVEDYLEVDEPIPGQEYVCLSFVSPEDIMQNKEAFKTAKFLQSMAKEKEKDFNYFYNMYLDFVYKHRDALQKDFDKENKFKTNIRGLKVRGVYRTEDEARKRAKSLQLKDSSFNVFVAPVGYWLPWNPCPDGIDDEEFLNEQLNEMIKKYKENEVNKDILYEEEKRNKLKDQVTREKYQEQLDKEKENEVSDEKEKTETISESTEPTEETEVTSTENDPQIQSILEGEDPWLKSKNSDTPAESETPADPEPEPETPEDIPDEPPVEEAKSPGK